MASATPRAQRPVAILAGGSTGIGAASGRLAADLAGAHRGSTP